MCVSPTWFQNNCLKGLGMIQKQGHWVPYELKPRTTASTAEKKRFFASHRIVTGDEKWIHYDNPKRRKSWGKPGLYAQRHDKVILLHDNARPHVAKPVKTYLETLKWEVLPHPPYSPDIAPSDFHLFRSMAHGLADRRFHSYEEAQKWIDSWIASKDMSFFRRGIHVLPERWEKSSLKSTGYFHPTKANFLVCSLESSTAMRADRKQPDERERTATLRRSSKYSSRGWYLFKDGITVSPARMTRRAYKMLLLP
ncbi:MOS1T transposase, partial [Pseudoatta argentina]